MPLNICDLLVALSPREHRGTLLDIIHPHQSVHDAVAENLLGIDPLNARSVDTRSVAGFGLTALDLDPGTTDWLAGSQ